MWSGKPPPRNRSNVEARTVCGRRAAPRRCVRRFEDTDNIFRNGCSTEGRPPQVRLANMGACAAMAILHIPAYSYFLLHFHPCGFGQRQKGMARTVGGAPIGKI